MKLRSVLATALPRARRLVEHTFGPRSRVLIGHSHGWCVTEAAQREGFLLESVNLWRYPHPVETLADGRPRFRTEIEERLRGRIFSFIGGGYHLALGALFPPRLFDFAYQEAPLATGVEVLPLGALRQSMGAYVDPFMTMIGLAAGLGRGRLSHFQSPPPLADSDRVARDLTTARRQVSLAEVLPAPVRRKLWLLHSEIVSDRCREIGVEFVPCPSAAFDDAGFLHPDFYLDPVHVNVGYGALVVEQMRRIP